MKLKEIVVLKNDATKDVWTPEADNVSAMKITDSNVLMMIGKDDIPIAAYSPMAWSYVQLVEDKE